MGRQYNRNILKRKTEEEELWIVIIYTRWKALQQENTSSRLL